MGEIGIHLENILIASLQRPFETVNVCGAQALLARTLFDEKLLSVFVHLPFHQLCGAIWRAVIHYQDIKINRKGEHLFNDANNILLFVIGGYDN